MPRRSFATCLSALGLLGLLAPGLGAQEVVLSLTNTPSPVKVATPVVYSLVVSNGRRDNLPPGQVLSAFPTTAQVLQATNSQGGSITTNTAGRAVFEIPFFTNNAVIRIGLTLVPSQTGFLTNTFTVTTPVDGSPLLQLATNSVTVVAPLQADLAVTVTPPPPGVFAGDTFAWRLLATNAGPDPASGVVVTNPLPPGVTFLSGSPPNQVSLSGNAVLFSAGTLTNTASAAAILQLLAVAAGTNTLAATVGAGAAVDPNPTNNSFVTNLVILVPDTNVLVCRIVSTQTFVPQTGLMEQRIAVSNAGPDTVDSFRVLVGGLTNAVINASGTNAGVPFVSHGAALAAGETLELLLEYFNRSRQPGADPVLTAYPTPTLELTPRAGTPVAIARLVLFDDGRTLIEFASSPGARYQVQYAPDVGSHSFLGSLPEITAGANRAQWTDYGPPRTTSQPAIAPARFYRVIQLP